MKLQILQENLSKALATASRFSSTKLQLPVLGNILLSAKKSKLIVSSTNLEVSVSISIGAKVLEEGELSVPAKVITELVGNLPHETIDCESIKEQLKLSTSGFSSIVLGMNSNDFPKIPGNVNTSNMLSIQQKSFAEALSQVLFAVSMDETRPILTGVLLIVDKGYLSLVSTDGFRLSQKRIKIDSLDRNFKIVLPKTILSEIPKITGDENIFFGIEEKEKQAIFVANDTVLSSRLLEGDFPDYEKIIPKSSFYKILVDKEEILRAVKLASIFARENANILKIKVLKDLLKISAESGQSGNQETNVDAKVESESSNLESGFEIAFNYKYLEDFLHSVSGEEVLLEFSSPTTAGVFKDSSDSSYLHLIMPVRVQG